MKHPCLSCGACCAYFRVGFYWRESQGILADFSEDLDQWHCAMKGTTSHHRPVCIALKAKVGKEAKCMIYNHRPAPCRDFKASYENGIQNKRCDEARSAHGLQALTKKDYKI